MIRDGFLWGLVLGVLLALAVVHLAVSTIERGLKPQPPVPARAPAEVGR